MCMGHTKGQEIMCFKVHIVGVSHYRTKERSWMTIGKIMSIGCEG
jgi:hypothetical protein